MKADDKKEAISMHIAEQHLFTHRIVQNHNGPKQYLYHSQALQHSELFKITGHRVTFYSVEDKSQWRKNQEGPLESLMLLKSLSTQLN